MSEFKFNSIFVLEFYVRQVRLEFYQSIEAYKTTITYTG